MCKEMKIIRGCAALFGCQVVGLFLAMPIAGILWCAGREREAPPVLIVGAVIGAFIGVFVALAAMED